MTLVKYLSTWGWLILVALLSGIMNWIGVVRRDKTLVHIFKPLTLFVLLLAAWFVKSGQHSDYMRSWFLPALFFSLCGDVFLMFSGNKYFLLGLVSFLIAHICFIAGLNSALPPAGVWVIVLAVAFIYTLIYPKIDRELKQQGNRELRIPAAIYSIILCLMVVSAWTVLLRNGWSITAQIVVVSGGTLFFISDLLLAWNRFVNHTHQRDVAVMVTYQLAQVLLTASIALSP